MTEARAVSGHDSRLSRTPQRSGRKTPIQRINSASGHRRFSVFMEIKLSRFAGPNSLNHYYEQNPKDFNDAITLALQNDVCGVLDPEVKAISCKDTTIHVELLYRSVRCLLSVEKKLPESTREISEQLRKIGLNEDIELSIARKEELDMKVKQTRLLQRRTEGIGMSKMHKDIISRQWENFSKNLETNKVLKKLMEKGIFDDEDKKEIDAVKHPFEKNDKFLAKLLDKTPDAFSDFIEILEGGTQWHLALNLLREENEEYKKLEEAFMSHVDDLNASTKEILEEKWLLEEERDEERRKREILEEKNEQLNRRITDLEKNGPGGTEDCSNSQLASGEEDNLEGDDKDNLEKDGLEWELSELKDDQEQDDVENDLIVNHGNQESRIIPEECKRLIREITYDFNAMINRTFQRQTEMFEHLQNDLMTKFSSEIGQEPDRKNKLDIDDQKQIQEKCEKLQEELTKKDDEIKQLTDDLTKKDELKTEIDDEKEQIKEQLQKIKEENKALQETIKSIEDEKCKISSDVDKESAQCKRLQSEIYEKDKKIEKLQKIFTKRQNLEAKLNVELAKNKNLNREVDKHRKDIEESKRKRQDERKKLQNKLKEKEEEIKNLHLKLDVKHKQVGRVKEGETSLKNSSEHRKTK